MQNTKTQHTNSNSQKYNKYIIFKVEKGSVYMVDDYSENRLKYYIKIWGTILRCNKWWYEYACCNFNSMGNCKGKRKI